MNPREKREILNSLTEKEFRQDIIIPLLSKMGFLAPMEYHGANERGKDIICFEYDRLNEQRFLSVVAKTGDLTGRVSDNSGLMTIVNQIQQAFDSPYDDLYNMRQVFISEVWVMTTGKIVSAAQESVIHTLRKSNLDKRIRIIGDDRLIHLIDKHFSTYWNSSTETKESVIIQRDNLIHFVESLLSANGTDKTTIEEVKSSILYSARSPRISKNIEGLYFAAVSPYSIKLSMIDGNFDDFIVSKIHGITSKMFQETKKYLHNSLYSVEEIIYHADRILKLTNPREFLDETKLYLAIEYPFHNVSAGMAWYFMRSIRDLEDGLDELEYFKKFLNQKGKLTWAKELSKSIIELLPDIENIIESAKEEEITINYKIDISKNKVVIEYKANSDAICFTSKFERISNEKFGRNPDGTLKPMKVIESALFELRKYIESRLEYDEEERFEENED